MIVFRKKIERNALTKPQKRGIVRYNNLAIVLGCLI